MKPQILLVEPDPARAKQVSDRLRRGGYAALVAPDAAAALRCIYESRPAAVLLSDRLPLAEIDHLTERIVTMTDLPLLILTEEAPLAEVAGRLAGSTGLEGLRGALEKFVR